MNKKVAIIILVYNGRQFLPDCLSSLTKITYPKDQYQIIVVDNASTDDSVNYIVKNYQNVKLIKNSENYGFAQGNNIGIQYAIDKGYDYIYLLNQDTVVDPNFLDQVVKLAENSPKTAIIQSKLLYYNDKTIINSRGNVIHFLGFGWADGNLEEDNACDVKEINYASGACMLIKITILKEIGLLDKDLFCYHEDLELCWRAKIFGYKIMLAAKSVVFHKYEFSRSITKYYYMERNRYMVMLQYYKWPTLFLIGPAMDIMEIGLFLFSIKSGWWKEKIKVYKYLLNGKNLEKIFLKRRKIQSMRRVGDREMVRHFAGKIEHQEIKNPIIDYLVNPFFNFYWQIIKRIIWW
ncbi:glycosyltransferase family 2 protein [Patescibacteria group bacterium]|nr:glycosyltransferase family 2 protein [Patescibacteria group bacterium]